MGRKIEISKWKASHRWTPTWTYEKNSCYKVKFNEKTGKKTGRENTLLGKEDTGYCKEKNLSFFLSLATAFPSSSSTIVWM